MATPAQIARYKDIAKELNKRITRREIEETTAEDLIEFERENDRLAALGEPPKQLAEVEEVEIKWEDVQTWAAETVKHATNTLTDMGYGQYDLEELKDRITNEVLSGLVLPNIEDDSGNIIVIEGGWEDAPRFQSNTINSMMATDPVRAIILNQLVEANEHADAFPAEITKYQQLRAISQSMENNGDVSNGFNNAVRGIGTYTAEDDRAATEWITSLSVINPEGRTVLQEHIRAASGNVNNRGDLAGQLQSESARILRGMSDEELRKEGSVFGNFGMPALPPNVGGSAAIAGRLTEGASGFITSTSIKAAIKEALIQEGINFRETDFPDTVAGKEDFKAATRIYDVFVSEIEDFESSLRDGLSLDDLQIANYISGYIEDGIVQFPKAFGVERRNQQAEKDRIVAETADAALKKANETPEAGLKLLKSLMYQANISSSPDDLLPKDYDALLKTVLAGGGVKPVEGDFPNTESFERAMDEYDEFVSDVGSATERFNTSEQDKLDVQAGFFDISDNEILRALETAGFGNVGGTGEYQQLLRSFIPEIRDNLEDIRRKDPTAELDVATLLQGDKAFSVAGKAGTDGILAGIEGFQSEEEFDAEELRMDETILPALPKSETRDREFLDDDEQNIQSTPAPSTPFLPPGVPGLPTLADTGVISSSELDAQREKALELEIPDFGEIQDLVSEMAPDNAELQRFIFDNLDLTAIKKSGRDEAARRRQEAFDDASRLSETPEPFEMPDTSRLSPAIIAQLEAQKKQRSKTPVLTGAQSARYADRALPKVDFGGLVRDELPELTRRFKASSGQVASRQSKAEGLKADEKRKAELLATRRESKSLRGSRTVFSRRAGR